MKGRHFGKQWEYKVWEGEGEISKKMFNPAAFLRLSKVRSLWPLLVLYDSLILVSCV